jgi:hypothetical protein
MSTATRRFSAATEWLARGVPVGQMVIKCDGYLVPQIDEKVMDKATVNGRTARLFLNEYFQGLLKCRTSAHDAVGVEY